MQSSGKNWPGLVVALAGVFGLLSMVLVIAGIKAANSLVWYLMSWGDLLYRSLHLAGLYIPIYLIICGVVIYIRRESIKLIILLSLGMVPALFAGLALRLMLSQDFGLSLLPAWMVLSLTHQGAVIVATALSLISLIMLLQLPGYWERNPAKPEPNEPKPRPTPNQPTKPQATVEAVESGEAAPTVSVVEEFSQAMEGKLESRIRPANPAPVDLDAPLNEAELNQVWTETPEKLDQAFKPEYKARRPMFYDPNAAEEDDADDPQEAPNTEVYFSKDGGISDYPPRGRHSFVTTADDIQDIEEIEEADEADEIEEVDNIQGPVAATIIQPVKPPESPVIDFTDQADDNGEWEDDYDESAGEGGVEPAAPEAEPTDKPPIVQPAPIKAIVPEAEAIDTKALPPITASKTWTRTGDYLVPIQGILEEPQNHQYWVIDDMTTRSAAILKQTLEEFGIAADVTGIRKGPVITMFEILPAPGVKLAKIVNLADNIALRLAAQSVRIVAPIPGKHAVGIEIPNKERAVVSFAELLMAEGFRAPKVEIPVALGKDISGDAQIVDLTRTPHLLIAGATGSGKSVCVNALICSILYRRSPAEVKMILIDPKIVELKFYNDIPHLLTPVITDPKKAFQALQWCIFEMERRYSLLDAMAVRDIKSYNKKIKARTIATPHLPYLVVVIDEFADLMATSGKELEGTLARLAAMSRAVGIHLVLATQRPSADVITGLIKANIPSRIAFMVASKIDSRIIIDGMGAEKLLGKGDMLFTSAWDPFPFRIQGAFLSEEEVERIVAHVKTLGAPEYIDDEIFFDAEDEEGDDDDIIDAADDPLLKEAIDIVVSAKKASASYLQRRLKVGYNRAARMIEQMEEMGIVGPAQGSKARDILRMY